MKPSFTDNIICNILTREYLSNLKSSSLEKTIYLKDCQIEININLPYLEFYLKFLLDSKTNNLSDKIEVGRVFYKIAESKEEESGVLISRLKTIINFNITKNGSLNFTNHSLFIELLEENKSFKEWLVWNVL